MKTSRVYILILIALLAVSPLQAQESTFQMFQTMNLPREFNPHGNPSCKLEFQEEWIIDPAGSSISKTVNSFALACDDLNSSASLPEGTSRLKNISFEFSFLDLPEPMAKEIQERIITLVNGRQAIPEHYNPQDQLLSIYFHEDWSLEGGDNTFTKKVRGISPVIWQRRQRADGEPVLDPDTGLPVFYKLELERIDLRNP